MFLAIQYCITSSIGYLFKCFQKHTYHHSLELLSRIAKKTKFVPLILYPVCMFQPL